MSESRPASGPLRNDEGKFASGATQSAQDQVPEGPDQWYSDEALEKQRIVNEWPKDKPLPLELIVGIAQPRTQPEQHERCVCCELDARDEANGVDVDGKRYCGICYGRDHHRD